MSKEDENEDLVRIGEKVVFPETRTGSGSLEGAANGEFDRLEGLEGIQHRISTLLKMETVSLLLGAGASVDCGGVLIGAIPLAIERELLKDGVKGKSKLRIRKWLKLFYLAVCNCGGGEQVPITNEAIIERRKKLNGNSASELRVNFEQVLAQLHRWRSALPKTGGKLRIYEPSELDVSAEDLDAALKEATRALARACVLPTKDRESGLATYTLLLRKLLTRPLNLKRVNVFTLNYDTLVEQAADAEGVVLLDGFVGTQRRVFRPESYEQDLYFPAETTEGRVHRFDRVLHLYKLHGSITWRATEPTIENPYGVQSEKYDPKASEPLLIYPTPAKYGETLGLPYSELFRRFAAAIVRPQSVLFVIGYGFGDEHVNAIIRQGLAIPSFTLVIVDPAPKSDFVTKLLKQQDSRVWVVQGRRIGKFEGFVRCLLPDLREEEFRKKVMETYRALAEVTTSQEGSPNGK